MTKQPEALRLADDFEIYAEDHEPDGWPAVKQKHLTAAAAELRRLYEVNQELLEALKHGGCPPDCKDGMTDSGGVHPWGEPALIPCPNCAAIAKGEQP